MSHGAFLQLMVVVGSEIDASFLAAAVKCLADCVRVLGGPVELDPEVRNGIYNAVGSQLHSLADKRRERQRRHPELISLIPQNRTGDTTTPVGASGAGDPFEDEREEILLMEELEDFALEEITKLLKYLDPNHSLLVAVSSVKELGLRSDEWESESEGSVGG